MSRQTKRPEIYMDHAAATSINSEVKKEMAESTKLYGNPSSFNDMGRLAGKKIDESRATVARFIGARPEEIVFTSSGSEANNLAIFGLTDIQFKSGEVITTPIEHPSVFEPIKLLKKRGWKITYLEVDSDGLININDFEKKLNPQVVLVSIIYANNEIGTIQPIKSISKVISNFRNHKLKIHEKMYPFFHVDACQATGYLDINVNNLGVDVLTFNGSKIYGPRGIGAFYIRRGVNIRPLILGGDQEYGLRAGTENLPAVVGLAKAVSLLGKKEGKRLSELRDYFLDKIQQVLPVRVNGPLGSSRLPNNINISIPDLDSENLLLELDKYGIYASAGSACTARSVEPSHVLKAIGVESRYLNGALRFSLGRQTTKKDIDYVLEVLPKIVGDLRKRYKK